MKEELVEGLKMLGPNVYVMDANFTADLTIIEEGHELLERLTRTLTGEKRFGGDHFHTELPMFTSCSPGWVYYVEKYYPEFINHLSSCKSPQ
jgi:iron only hydrogenase large subunit-like protein